MNAENVSRRISEILKNIANPVRLQVICHLLDGKKNVTELLLLITISQSALSQHLSALKKKKILEDEKIGKFIYYSIANPETAKILSFLKEVCNK